MIPISSSMSFTICYPDNAATTSRSHRSLSLTGLVGRDGQLYWLEQDAAKLFTNAALIPVALKKVSDVTGFIPHHLHRLHHPEQRYHCHKLHYYRNWFLKKRVLSHVQLCQAFQNTSVLATTHEQGAAAAAAAARIRHFGDLLNDPDTHVTEETDPVNKNPVLCIHHSNNNNIQNNPPTPSSSSMADVETYLRETQPVPFFVWLGCYTVQIHQELYQSPPPSPVSPFTLSGDELDGGM